MWEQYKKTIVSIQLVIGVVTAGVFVWRPLWDLAALFFVTMQIAAVVGASWGHRLQNKVQRASDVRRRA